MVSDLLLFPDPFLLVGSLSASEFRAEMISHPRSIWIERGNHGATSPFSPFVFLPRNLFENFRLRYELTSPALPLFPLYPLSLFASIFS